MRRRLLAGLVALVSAAGCASAGSPTLATRFVRQGTPAVDLGGPRPLDSPKTKRPRPLEGASIAHGVSRLSTTVSSLEATDPALRDALLRVMLAPTAEHHLQVARAYRGAGILDQAHDYLTRSLTVNGPDPVIHDALARLWRDWGNPGLGLADAYRAVYLAPEWPAAHNTLGTLLYKLGLRDEARARFERVVALDPGAAYALDNLCRLSLMDGRTRDAIVQCRQADAVRAGRRPPAADPREPRR